MGANPRIRADQLVFDQGLAESREKAKSLIMAGRVLLRQDNFQSVAVPKPGHLYPASAVFSLRPGKDYVSRGAYKLLTLLDGFRLDVSGLICLDAGASTGGFTDCLLRRGASKVYAIDVGKNQLHEKLRSDKRVVSFEGVNLRDAPRELVPELVDVLVGDVSFISLTKILPSCVRWLKPEGFAAVLIKPQFELDRDKNRKGVVRKEEFRLAAVRKVTDFCKTELNLETIGVLPAQITGPKGNQEYMALMRAHSGEG